MKTTPTTIERVGPPVWVDVEGQPSCKYATPVVALGIARPWVAALARRMLATLPDANLVDIRWWAHLNPGDLPGIPAWHYDCFNEADHPRAVNEEHRLYFAGAGCRTMFDPDYQPDEGLILGYGHNARHRIMPATVAGPRLLVRVTRADIRPANRIGEPPMIGLTPPVRRYTGGE